MTKYIVHTEWSGYSRGISSYMVEADSKEEAEEFWYAGEKLDSITIRDDTENEVTQIEELGND